MTDKIDTKTAMKTDDKNTADVALIRELASILGETELTEIEIAEGEKRIRIKREITVSAAPSFAQPYVTAPQAAPAALQTVAATAAAPANTMDSPMVGTAYLAAKPGDAPFVRVGDTVKEGQTVLIIEAMKVMNPIKADRSGTVTQVLVTDAEPVEYGQPLLAIA